MVDPESENEIQHPRQEGDNLTIERTQHYDKQSSVSSQSQQLCVHEVSRVCALRISVIKLKLRWKTVHFLERPHTDQTWL